MWLSFNLMDFLTQSAFLKSVLNSSRGEMRSLCDDWVSSDSVVASDSAFSLTEADGWLTILSIELRTLIISISSLDF